MLRLGNRDVPETLEELAVPGKTAIVVIDMLNDFCSEGGVFHSMGGDLTLYPPAIDGIARLLAAAREHGVLVVHTQFTVPDTFTTESPSHLRARWMSARHKYRQPSFGRAKELVRPDSWGQDFVEELRPLPTETVLTKYRSSAFTGTSLDLVLRSNARDRLVVTGCVTEGCVAKTMHDAQDLDYFDILARDAVASDVPEYHDTAIRMLALRAETPTVDELIEVWTRSADTPAIASDGRVAQTVER